MATDAEIVRAVKLALYDYADRRVTAPDTLTVIAQAVLLRDVSR